MNLAVDFDVDGVVLVELFYYFRVPRLESDLDDVLVEVGGGTGPHNFLDDVVVRHVDGRALQAQRDDEALGLDLLAAVVHEEIHEAFHHELLQLLALDARLVDQLDLFSQLGDLPLAQLLPVDALLQLLVHDQIGKPPHWRCEVRVVVQVEPVVPFVSVEIARVDCEFLDLDRLQEQQLLQLIGDLLLVK